MAFVRQVAMAVGAVVAYDFPSMRPYLLLSCFFALACGPAPVLAQSSSGSSDSSRAALASARVDRDTQRDGQRDFDFEIGTWQTRLSRLQRPLSGSKTWVEYTGTSVVRKVWNGRSNLVELDVNGPAGRIEGLSLRLYNPESHQWSLNFASARGGTLTPPVYGKFENGRGEFFGLDSLDGRAILVRFVISNVTPTSAHFEQSFSDDGGKTWEVNWIATDTRAQ